MAESRYEKYISRKPYYLTKFADDSVAHAMEPAPTVWCDKHVFEGCNCVIEGSNVWADCSLGVRTNGKGTSIHKHPYEEFFLFKGMDPKNPEELGAEVEFWVGEGDETEKLVFTTSSVLYMPPNLAHFPMHFKNVKKPFQFFVFMPNNGESNPEAIDSRKASDFGADKR